MTMKYLASTILVAAGLFVAAGASRAAVSQTPCGQDPVPMLQTISNSVIAQLKVNEGKVSNDQIDRIVNRELLPHADLSLMAKAIARQAWFDATPAQQKAFLNELTTYYARTYGQAMKAYHDETVKFLPTRAGALGKKSMTVYSQIVHTTGDTVPVSYRLTCVSNVWKVVDLIPSEVSMVNSVREQLAEKAGENGVKGAPTLADYTEILKAHRINSADS